MSNINFKGIDSKDELNIEEIKQKREKIIYKTSNKLSNQSDVISELGEKLHPEVQFVKVLKIVEENENVKTFVLGPNYDAGTRHLAYFKPGQYVSVCVKLGIGIYSRPYTISCSPNHALDNYYTITIKREKEGLVSNFFFDEVEVGYAFSLSAPTGNFCYSALRDANNIVALVYDKGIIPISVIAEAIYDGIINCHLTILYMTDKKSDLIFKNKLDYLVKKCKKIKVEYILKDEELEGFKTGKIDRVLVEQYRTENTSYFVAGSLNFYEEINEILKALEVPQKNVRYELFKSDLELKSRSEYKLTVLTEGEEYHITCKGNVSLLASMEESGIIVPNKCHVGECGFCRSKLISGKIKTFDDSIRAADKDYNYIHPCCSYPESDIVIKLPN